MLKIMGTGILLFSLGHAENAPLQNDHLSRTLEFSFATAQMFFKTNERDKLWDEKGIALPSSAALFVGEYRWTRHWSLLSFFNLPLTTDKRQVNGEWREYKAAASMGTGLNSSFFHTYVRDFVFTTQLALGPTLVLREELPMTITAAPRLHLVTEEGFSMYVGLAYSLGIQGLVYWYGVGHRF